MEMRQMPASAAAVFAWHESPEALPTLLPASRFVQLERRDGGVADGAVVVIAVGVGAFRLRWVARHFGYDAGRQFCDDQVRGPFRLWRHVHRVEPIGSDQSLLIDRIVYTLPGGRLAHRWLEPTCRRMLARAFAERHRLARRAIMAWAPRHGRRPSITELRVPLPRPVGQEASCRA
ncbi:MAG: SRPBCC family protein [Acidobacteriota bacterium]